MTIFFDKVEELFFNNDQVSQVPETKSFNIPDGSSVIYEVIRVINGIPLFLDEHMDRLKQSTQLSGIDISLNQLLNGIIELAKRTAVKEKNLKISLYCNQTNRQECKTIAYFIESNYPSAQAYLNGVKVELATLERKNPNIKIENPTLRQSANKVLSLSQTHEALLVNDEGYITEGSRSNFFAIIDNTIITPPAKDVLEGVTRKMVIALARQNSLPLQERPIHKTEIDAFEGAFITGTSPKVLPISQIGDQFFPIPALTLELLEHYNKLTSKNLSDISVKYFNNPNKTYR